MVMSWLSVDKLNIELQDRKGAAHVLTIECSAFFKERVKEIDKNCALEHEFAPTNANLVRKINKGKCRLIFLPASQISFLYLLPTKFGLALEQSCQSTHCKDVEKLHKAVIYLG